MLRSAKQLYGYTLGAVDGEIGHVKGFYFDDKDWVIRYLVADTGSWLVGHKVLISPYALGSIYPGGKVLQVRLTRQKVEQSPSIETELPVARQHERAYYQYYNWPVYWSGPGLWGMNPVPLVPLDFEPEIHQENVADEADSRLRSTLEVTGYHVQATDGEIGHVEDFLIEDESWEIKSLVVATGLWWSGREVVVPRKEVSRVSWDESKVFVNITRDALMREPDYHHSFQDQDEHDPRLFRH